MKTFVWAYSFGIILGLRKKTVAPGSSGLEERIRSVHQTELFGQSDSIVKHVLEVDIQQMLALLNKLNKFWGFNLN